MIKRQKHNQTLVKKEYLVKPQKKVLTAIIHFDEEQLLIIKNKLGIATRFTTARVLCLAEDTDQANKILQKNGIWQKPFERRYEAVSTDSLEKSICEHMEACILITTNSQEKAVPVSIFSTEKKEQTGNE